MKKLREHWKAAAGAVAALVILAVVGIMAASGTAHFTYTNLEETQPDLYVSKTVTSVLDGYTVPDQEFTFVLKWDQDGDGYLEFASEVSYKLYDSTGKQIINENTSDGSFKTSSTGRFTLKDGQYAYFEFAGQVEYEITELDVDGFTQTVPSGGGTATGTIPAEGTTVEFENAYIPEDQEGEETMLAIRKDITWPDGYEVPDDITAEFTFSVKIDGELYKNQPYTVYNTNMTEELDRDTTDSEGKLTLQYGQVALFEEIDVGVDYEIEEVDNPDGWKVTGETKYTGSTTAPIIYAYFTNTGTTLTVDKVRSDGVTGVEDEFTFILTDNDGEPIAGAAYYVYDAKGNLTGNVLTTNEDGEFTLQAGQKAFFIGLAEGSYKVVEEDPDGYDRYPEEGYTAEVSFDNADDHTFTNTQLTNITIRKAEANDTSKLLAGAEFTIYKLKDDVNVDEAEDDDWEPYPDSDSAVKATSEDGILTYTDLPEGTYMIKETAAPEGYMLTGDPIIVTLPYSMTDSEIANEHVDTEADDFKGLYNSDEGAYYFYDITYDVTNMQNLMELPNTGGFPWLLLALIIGAILIAVGVYMYRRHKKKEGQSGQSPDPQPAM